MQAEIIVEFDENSPEFKELWDGYKSAINPEADYESFAENICSQISRYGVSDMIEGVGYLKLDGKNQKLYKDGEYKEMQSYVNIQVETDLNGMVDFDAYYTENLS